MDVHFETYWRLFAPDATFQNRKRAAQKVWEACEPRKQHAIIQWLQAHGAYKGRNPYFFILDFQTIHPKEQTLSYDDYYNRFRTTEEQGGWKRVYLAEEQRTVYVK